MPRIKLLPFCFATLISATSVFGQAAPNNPLLLVGHNNSRPAIADLQWLIPQLMRQARVPGLQIALIRGGRIVWHQNFGVRSAKTGQPVTDETIFEAASLTKPFFAYYVMKLAEQGVIDLDKPLFGYLPRELIEKSLGLSLEEKGFHRDWFEKITARHVLSHSSGMPHGERGNPFPLFFEPGTKWKYSADGYFYLQQVVEKLRGDRLENLMRKDVLIPLSMKKSRLVWNDEYERTMASGHGFFGRPEEFRKRREAHAAATLYTTAEDYAKFVCAVLNGKGLRANTLKEMLTSQIDMNKERGLGWSLGFGTQNDSYGTAIWQWGDYGIFRNYILAYPKEKTAVIYLTNSAYGLGVCPEIVAHSVGGQALGCLELKYLPYYSPFYLFAWDLAEKGTESVNQLPDLERRYPDVFAKDNLSNLVEIFQGENMMPQVIALLEANLKEHPESGSLLLSLAKAFLQAGDMKSARLSIEKSREAKEEKVSPAGIDWSLENIKALEHPEKLEEENMKRIAGDYGGRHIQFRDGHLYYLREGGVYPDYRLLIPMSKDTFLLEGVLDFRLKIEFDETGNPIKAVGLSEDGSRDETLRNK